MAIGPRRSQNRRLLSAAGGLQAGRLRVLLRQRGRGRAGAGRGVCRGGQARGYLCRDQGVGDVHDAGRAGAAEELGEVGVGLC